MTTPPTYFYTLSLHDALPILISATLHLNLWTLNTNLHYFILILTHYPSQLQQGLIHAGLQRYQRVHRAPLVTVRIPHASHLRRAGAVRQRNRVERQAAGQAVA